MVGKLFACDVDDAEPVQLLGIRSLAYVHEQLVIENLLFLIARQVVEILIVHGERPVNILAKRDGALLPVQHLVPRLIRIVLVLLASVNPVHHVQGQALHYGTDDLITLLVLVDELTLILWADVQLVIVADHAFLGVIKISLSDLTHGHLALFDMHYCCTSFGCSGCLLRMRMRAYA